jgi:hypothetical protein
VNESLSQVLVALASAGAAFASAGIGLVAVYRGSGASRASLVRSGLALLVPSLLAVLANLAAAGGVVSWAVPAGLGAVGAAFAGLSLGRSGKERGEALLLPLAGSVFAALSALAAFLLWRGLVA